MNAVDTNVFVYAIDSSESDKGAQAQSLLDRRDNEDTILFWQVACEFGAVCAKLAERGVSKLDVGQASQALRMRFPLVLPDPSILDAALQLRRDQGVSFWDALLLAACAACGVDVLYTEDLSDGATLLGVKIVNPFRVG